MIKNVLRIALSIGVSFAILALLLQLFTTGLADADRPSVFAVLQASSVSFVLAYVGLYFVSLFVRAYRYRLLIDLGGESNVPSFRQMILVTGIRNMVVDMLPARLGEPGYIALLNRGYGVKLQHCVSSLSISIAFDFVALLVVVIFIVVKQSLGQGITGWAIGALVMASALSAIAVFGLFRITPWLIKSIENFKSVKSALPDWQTEQNRRAKAIDLLHNFNQSLQAVLGSGKASLIILISVVIRVLKYLGFYLLFQAVAKNSFPELAALPVEHIVSALIGGEVGASLPIPAFMSFGVYEAGSSLVFQLLGVADQAATFVSMLCVHIWSQLIEYLLGGVFIVTFVLSNRWQTELRDQESELNRLRNSNIRNTVAFIVVGIVLLMGAVFLTVQLWTTTKLGALSAPPTGSVTRSPQRLSQQPMNRIDGFVVFSSNRDGNHDIFRRDLKTFELDKLTNHPNTETYPRISPNGELLVFSRAHQPWVSQRNTVAWDVYLLNLETMQERKIASNGTAPQWLNNSEISYLRDATVVERVNVNTLASSVIYQGGVNNNMPAGARLQNPKFNDVTKQLVFTARQSDIGSNTGHWGTAIDTNGKHRAVLNGCELSWTSDSTGLYQVTPDGADGTLRIVSVNPKSLEHKTLINLRGEFTHEYWPKDSSNGEYMVFGASRGSDQHEHDTQDYEIFLWKLGSDSGEATRLTFHTGNDNWPDVFVR
ncbi:MAG: flippase-like domain-containing protein [Arenicella sp.]|nr:flippase-like domain-containing protein [Arenicella sp.]